MTNFRLFQTQRVDSLKFDDIGEKFSKRVENTVGKGEIAQYKQFFLFPVFFRRLILQTHKNQGLFGKGLSQYTLNYYIYGH